MGKNVAVYREQSSGLQASRSRDRVALKRPSVVVQEAFELANGTLHVLRGLLLEVGGLKNRELQELRGKHRSRVAQEDRKLWAEFIR